MSRQRLSRFPSGLASLQAAVGGFIEAFSDAPMGYAIWMDAEGRLKDLTLNLLSPRGEVVGPLAVTRLSRNGRGSGGAVRSGRGEDQGLA